MPTLDEMKRTAARTAYRALRSLNVSNDVAFSWIGHRIADAQWSEAARKTSQLFGRTNGNGQRVVMLPMIGNMYLTRLELTLAMALQERGAQVELIYCDGSRPLCEMTTVDLLEGSTKDSICAKCRGNVQALLKDVPWIKARFLKDIVPAEAAARIREETRSLSMDQVCQYEVDGVQLGRAAIQTLCRHLRVGIPGERDVDKARQYLCSALLTMELTKRLMEEGPIDVALMSHGIYVSWAPALEYLRSNDVYVATYDRQAKRNSLVVNANVPCRLGDISAPFDERWRNRVLSDQEKNAAVAYFESRSDFTSDLLKLTIGDHISRQKAMDTIGLRDDLPVMVLFTNNMWDASAVGRDLVFESVLDWVHETIRFVESRPDECQLVIRTHPAEAIRGTRQSVVEEVRSDFATLPENVHLLEPDIEISSTSILQLADVGLVHTSTVGMELAIRGTPVVVCSQTHYRGIGFTYDPTTRDEYFDLLAQFLSGDMGMSAERQELALKYFYVRFFKYCLDIPLYKFSESNVPRELTIGSFDEIQRGRFPDLDFLCESILAHRPYFLKP